MISPKYFYVFRALFAFFSSFCTAICSASRTHYLKSSIIFLEEGINLMAFRFIAVFKKFRIVSKLPKRQIETWRWRLVYIEENIFSGPLTIGGPGAQPGMSHRKQIVASWTAIWGWKSLSVELSVTTFSSSASSAFLAPSSSLSAMPTVSVQEYTITFFVIPFFPVLKPWQPSHLLHAHHLHQPGTLESSAYLGSLILCFSTGATEELWRHGLPERHVDKKIDKQGRRWSESRKEWQSRQSFWEFIYCKGLLRYTSDIFLECCYSDSLYLTFKSNV